MDDVNDQQILAQREQTRAALNYKFEELEGRLQNGIQNIKTTIANTTDISYQVKRRPWKTLGASVWAGYTIGRMLSGGSRRGHGSSRRNAALALGSRVAAASVERNGRIPRSSRIVRAVAIGVIAAILKSARHALPVVVTYLHKRTGHPGMGQSTTKSTVC